MKKSLTYIVILLLIFSGFLEHLNAQSELPERRFKGGLIVGMNLSQIDGDFLINYNKLGLNTGLTASAILTKHWEIGIELLFSQKGSRRTSSDGIRVVSGFDFPLDKIRLNYVEAPLLIHFHNSKFRVSSGISYARLLNYEIIDMEGEINFPIQNIRSSNFTFIIGVDYFLNQNWGIGIRWSRESDILVKGIEGDFRGRTLNIRSSFLF